MATQIQENLQKKNAEYASSFEAGHLALPPAKKYAVGKDCLILYKTQFQYIPD